MDIGPLEQQVLLAILRQHPDAYGVSIRDFILERAGKEHSIGSIYAALGRLEDKGFIRSREGEATPRRGGRSKLHFTITAPGQAALQNSLQTISQLSRGLRWQGALRFEVVP